MPKQRVYYHVTWQTNKNEQNKAPDKTGLSLSEKNKEKLRKQRKRLGFVRHFEKFKPSLAKKSYKNFLICNYTIS